MFRTRSGPEALHGDRPDPPVTRLDERPVSDGSGYLDPEITHKVVHACMDAEYISEDEELRILGHVLPHEDVE